MLPSFVRCLAITIIVAVVTGCLVYQSTFHKGTLAILKNETLCGTPEKDDIGPRVTAAPLIDDVGNGPLKLVREKLQMSNLSTLDLDKLNNEDLRILAYSYPDSEEVICKRRIRMGEIGDGGWEICDDSDVRPRQPCVIYSFGINNDFSLDDDASRVYGCQVYSFDPSMEGDDQYNRSDLVFFYKIGLHNSTHSDHRRHWSMYSYADIRKMLGHARGDVSLVKMDIEGDELSALPQMLASGELDGVRQLLMEYHIETVTRDSTLATLKLLQAIERAGFKKFYSHKNPTTSMHIDQFPVARPCCYEVHYLRR